MLSTAIILVLYVLGARAVLHRFNFTLHSDLRSPDGYEREVYLINGQQPGPLIEVDEGDDIVVHVQNDLQVETTFHWHGLLQRGSPDMDGVPGVTQDPIPPGGNFTYWFSTKSEYGFYWYHSHFRAYYNDAIRGPLLIRPAAWRQRPFAARARTDGEKAALLEAERQATNILLNDWTHELSDIIFERYSRTGAFPSCVDSILANGLGRVQCLPEDVLRAGPQPDMPTREQGRASVPEPNTSEMPTTNALSPRGCMPPGMFNPGFNMSSLPPEVCVNTTSPLLTVSANHTTGWLALNFVNSGAVSALSVSLDGHSMFVYAADGLYVEMQEVKVLRMELGQRYSVMVKLNQRPASYYLRFATYPSGDMQQVLEGRAVVSYAEIPTGGIVDDASQTWMFINGSAKPGAARLTPQGLAPFEKKSNAPPGGRADKTLSFVINQTDITTWVLDRAPFKEPEIPVIYGNASSGWTSNTTMHLPLNSTVDIILNIASDSMDTMGHPLHLHGHKFWVLGSGTGSFAFESVQDAPTGMLNVVNPPFRDTTGLPARGWAVIRYITDNPGAWIFHCHLQWHVVVGMAVVLVEGQDQLPALVGNYSKSTPPVRSGGEHTAAVPCDKLRFLAAIVAVVSGCCRGWLIHR